MTSATKTSNRKGAYRKLGILLTMDFSVVVLFRHNRATKRQTCIWAEGPDEITMRKRAATYIGKITELDLSAVEWVRSAELLALVNRPNAPSLY